MSRGDRFGVLVTGEIEGYRTRRKQGIVVGALKLRSDTSSS